MFTYRGLFPVKHEAAVTYDFGNIERNLLVPAINNLEKEDCKVWSQFYALSSENMSRIEELVTWDVYGSGPSEFYYDGDDLTHAISWWRDS